jgi:hypothetical protein
MNLYLVSVISKIGRRQRKHDGANYLILAESPEDAQSRIAEHQMEYGNPIHISLGELWGDGGPIALTHYSLSPAEVAVRVKRQPKGAIYQDLDI